MGILSDIFIGFIGLVCIMCVWGNVLEAQTAEQEIKYSEIIMQSEPVEELEPIQSEQSEVIERVTYNLLPYAGEDGHQLRLVENVSAVDPTYAQLNAFLNIDQTNQMDYEIGSFTCGDFAEMLQNNAENAGINAGWVSVDFVGEDVGHACNVFNTTDHGIIFIDCTTAGYGVHSDKTVDIVIGREYIPKSRTSTNVEYPSMGYVKNYDIYW